MRGRSRIVLGTFIVLNAVHAAAGQQLGRPASPEELKAVDLSIAPDGAGLPPGQGNAKDGEVLYNRLCAACHGPKGVGGPNDRLVGGTLSGKPPVKTVGTFWQWPTTLFD